jgi:hypothetical protein
MTKNEKLDKKTRLKPDQTLVDPELEEMLKT